VGSYKFNYHLLDINQKYLIENHLVVIKFKGEINDIEHKKKLIKLINSFNDEKSKEFVNLYFGNNAINCSELLHCLPIFGFD
jgi:hypothetical protein